MEVTPKPKSLKRVVELTYFWQLSPTETFLGLSTNSCQKDQTLSRFSCESGSARLATQHLPRGRHPPAS